MCRRSKCSISYTFTNIGFPQSNATYADLQSSGLRPDCFRPIRVKNKQRAVFVVAMQGMVDMSVTLRCQEVPIRRAFSSRTGLKAAFAGAALHSRIQCFKEQQMCSLLKPLTAGHMPQSSNARKADSIIAHCGLSIVFCWLADRRPICAPQNSPVNRIHTHTRSREWLHDDHK